jgi:hypothetical protein
MTFKKFLFALPIFLIAALFVTSCSDNDSTSSDIDVENYVENAVDEMNREAMCGRKGCFEFVFPITINFPDSTSAEVGSYEEMKETIKTWREAHPDAETRPTLAFPLDIMTEGGEIISLESRAELRRAIAQCIRNWAKKHPRFNNPCFVVVFPMILEMPDGSIKTVDDREELKELLRALASIRPRPDKRPKLVFPITVKLKEDGSEVVVSNAEELAALKEDCRGE